MAIQKVSAQNINTTQKPKMTKDRMLKRGAFLTGTTALGAGTFLVADTFSKSRKDYKAAVEKLDSGVVENLERAVENDLEKLRNMGKEITQEIIDTVVDFQTTRLKLLYDEQLSAYKRIRNTHIFNGLRIAIPAGLATGIVALVAHDLSNKPKENIDINQQKTAQINNQEVLKNQEKIQAVPINVQQNTVSAAKIQMPDAIKNCMNNNANKAQVAFTGVLDQIADQLTTDEYNTYKEYIKGENPSSSETELAKRIAAYSFEKDWPNGLNANSRLLFGIDDNYPVSPVPKNDMEYHRALLAQEIVVPSMPPKYYRNYDKIFNTDRWQDFQKWPDYIEKATKFERMENIITKERMKRYAREKQELDIKAKKELSAAYIKYLINQDFLIHFNSDNKNVKIPNAIMILGKDKEDTMQTLKWIVAKSSTNYIFIPDKHESNEVRRNQLLTVLEDAQQNYEKNKKRTLIWMENFSNLLSNDSDNQDVIADLKSLLDVLSSTYKATLIFNCENTKDLDPIVLQPHRVKKYNIDKEVSSEEFKEFHNDYVLSRVKKMPDTDGYQFAYQLFNDEMVDLYLGEFGYNDKVLWVESQNPRAILSVVENIDAIKHIDRFKNAETLEFPIPNDLTVFDSDKLFRTYRKTENGIDIYGYELKDD